MIRLSAGLVAVAIGVLIGGIATSKLLLVYIAIVLSAVALVALAIGVVLKREELFGEAQGTAPAQAGGSPVVTAHASGRDDQNRPNGYVTPAAPQGATVGPGAAFAAPGQATSPQPRGTWQDRAGGDSRPSPVTASSFPAARQAAAPFGAPTAGEPPAPRGPAVQGGGTEPRSPGASAPSVFAPRTASTSAAAPGAGPGADQSDWFSPPGKAASADRQAPGTGAARSWVNADITVPRDKGAEEQGEAEEQDKPADAPAPEDADWPARSSWLDGKPAGSGDASEGKAAGTVEPAGTVKAGQEGAAPESGSPVAQVDAGPRDVVAPDASASPEMPDAGVPAPEAPDPGTHEAKALRFDGEADAGEEDAGAHLAAPAEADEQAPPGPVRDLAPEAGKPAVPGEPEGEPSAATAAADDAGLVIVVRGVPRFHQRDCVLIRFMSDDDTQKLSVAQAEEAGCTPCAACQSV